MAATNEISIDAVVDSRQFHSNRKTQNSTAGFSQWTVCLALLPTGFGKSSAKSTATSRWVTNAHGKKTVKIVHPITFQVTAIYRSLQPPRVTC